ncbi:hypothetical protein PVK06_005063 [Gossypium arboreum]|uniref:Uncharacterized protein n=1 Tax=Gossypium arboreum TaxID=29729 RepID=A0ABR0QTM0_GOSAR|nr:hypothetical protein PVK06_005063 [Gossypium arboreum]
MQQQQKVGNVFPSLSDGPKQTGKGFYVTNRAITHVVQECAWKKYTNRGEKKVDVDYDDKGDDDDYHDDDNNNNHFPT